MAKLFVTRPRLGSSWDIEQCFDVLIDGNPNAPIGPGETIEIALPPGPHLVGARFEIAESQPILVEMAPGERHRLAVGTNVGLGRLESWCVILAFLPIVGLVVWMFIDTVLLLHRLNGGRTLPLPGNWRHPLQMALMVPSVLLPCMYMLAHRAFSRNHALVFAELPNLDLEVEEIATLLRELPFRVRITIRQLMIAVAISALCFWISLKVFRANLA